MEDERAKAARTAFMLALALTIMGCYGVFRGVQGLGEFLGSGAEAASDQEFLTAFYNDPHRRPLAAANIIVSAMLLVGATLLVMKRKSAIWWLRQTVLANLVWVGIHLWSALHHTYANAPELLALLDAGTGGLIRSGESRFDWLVVTLIVFGSINVLAYGFVAWRVGRSDIRKFLDGE